jgi:hypothetical protein
LPTGRQWIGAGTGFAGEGNAGEGGGEDGGFGRVPEIAGQGERQAGAGRRAGNARDGRFRHPPQLPAGGLLVQTLSVSVPATVARRAKIDILIVHTSA